MIKKFLFLILFLSLASTTWAASKEGAVKQGNALYTRGKFESALESYQNALKADPESPAINFNLGTALYKNKRYDQAIPYLQKGLLSDDVLLKKNAHFNLGDALYARGVNLGEKQVDQAIAALEESLRQFTTVVNVDDKDKDAQYNRDIVQKELERLKKKKQQQEKQQNENKDQKQEKQDSQHDQNQSQDKKPSETQSQKEQSANNSSQPENKDGQEKKEEQKPQQGFSQNTDQKDKPQQQNEQSQVPAKPGEMTQEEAKALLKQFEQSPEATGVLNFDKHKTDEPSVLKDW